MELEKTNNRKEIDDQKTLYLIRTLSRTKRKDYENYVINAIWHKLSNVDIEVVSQQYVKTPAGSYYFIDLYFPALNIGIECDEAYHKFQSEVDKEREATIFDVLYAVNSETFEEIRIDVTQSFADLQNSLDRAVAKIKKKIEERKPNKWVIEKASDYYKYKTSISIHHTKGFKTINDACNVLFNAGRKEISRGASRAYFGLPTFKNTPLEGYKLWFPKLAIRIKNEEGKEILIAASKGWHNQLVDNGYTIIESNENNSETPKPDGRKRIVFVKYKDPLGYNEYKFAGIFEFDRATDRETFFKRVDEEVALIKPKMLPEDVLTQGGLP